MITRKHKFAQISYNFLCDIILCQNKTFIRLFLKCEVYLDFFKIKKLKVVGVRTRTRPVDPKAEDILVGPSHPSPCHSSVCQTHFARHTKKIHNAIAFHMISSVAQSCPTLCDPINRSTPGLPVHHQLPEFTQTHVHRVSDAIQPSHPLSSPSPPTFNLSQHHGLFK